MRTTTALEPFDTKQITFYGDTLTLAIVEKNQEFEVYVPLRPICDHLSLSWSGQHERILRHPVLSQEAKLIRLNRGSSGGNPNKLCLPINFLHGWLFTISPSRSRPELTQKLLQYRRECFRALSQPFQNSLLSIKYLATPSAHISEVSSSTETIIYPLTLQQIREAVHRQYQRAEQLGLPATLTVSQWIYTLKLFEGNCAYCQSRPGIILEHFIPLSLNTSGTTIGNCVPSCFSCNTKKSNKHPDQITTISQQVLSSIQRKLKYLEGQFPF